MNKITTLMPESELPAPRLELRWEKVTPDWSMRICKYSIVIPLGEHDIRREDRHGNKVRNEQALEIGSTKVDGHNGAPIRRINGEDRIDVPFRDGAHARWDSMALNLPVYVVCNGLAHKLEESKS